jgi:energy-coupling factor transport system permease protein
MTSMNNRFMINYTRGTTPLHHLNGVTKILAFVTMTTYIIMTFDIRVMVPLFCLCTIGVASMRPNWKPIGFVVAFMTVMAGVIGSLLIIFVRPQAGFNHVGGATYLIHVSDHLYLTKELLWYVGVMFFKRLTSLSTALVFVLSITPSELASGMNRLCVPYKACTLVSLAFRTIPDIARNFTDISNSLMMRGAELDAKHASLASRLKAMTFILVPLVLTSFGRVEVIANAMDLRGYGKKKKRTWYTEYKPTAADWVARALIAAVFAFCLWYIIDKRVINPPSFDYWYPGN